MADDGFVDPGAARSFDNNARPRGDPMGLVPIAGSGRRTRGLRLALHWLPGGPSVRLDALHGSRQPGIALSGVTARAVMPHLGGRVVGRIPWESSRAPVLPCPCCLGRARRQASRPLRLPRPRRPTTQPARRQCPHPRHERSAHADGRSRRAGDRDRLVPDPPCRRTSDPRANRTVTP